MAAQLSKVGFVAGQVVQEIGYDSDTDDDVRLGIETLVAGELEDEDYTGAADAVLLWWRSDDGDLVDALVDAQTNLADQGFLLLMTPKSGRDGHVEAADTHEAAVVAGLLLVGTANVSSGWVGTRVVAAQGARR